MLSLGGPTFKKKFLNVINLFKPVFIFFPDQSEIGGKVPRVTINSAMEILFMVMMTNSRLMKKGERGG